MIFDLFSYEVSDWFAVIIANGGNISNYTTSYYTALDASGNPDPSTLIDNPSSYQNTSTPNQVIYASVTDNITGCIAIKPINLHVDLLPEVNFTLIEVCDDDDDETEGDGFYEFDLTSEPYYSNLTGGINVSNVGTKAGIAGAVDLSYSYYNEDVKIGGTDATFSIGTTISNIGNKIAYTVDSYRDFLPTNLRLGTALKMDFDDYNSLTGTVDFNKLLVPTRPEYASNGDIISGMNTDVGVVTGILHSFYDAPGNVFVDPNGDVEVEKGSRFGEEMREINIALGVEYWYSNILAARIGLFYEDVHKGARQYMTFGAGIYYSVFGIDVSYLAAFNNTNPLANTVRFSLKFKFGSSSQNNPSVD